MKEIYEDVLSRGGRYREVRGPREKSTDPSPLKVKEVRVGQVRRRYVVCLNQDQATKDRHDREAIVTSLGEALKQGDKALIGNKGFRRYVAASGERFIIDSEKIKAEERYDGLWVLITNTTLSAREVALKYKQLWMVEAAFRSMKSLLATRPISHQADETIVGHVFCSFLALLLRKGLQDRLEAKGENLEWAELLRDLEALAYTEVESEGKRFLLAQLTWQARPPPSSAAVGVAIPPSVQNTQE